MYDPQQYWEEQANNWLAKMDHPGLADRDWQSFAWLLEGKADNPNYRVVELGCGFGRFAPYFANYLGLDISRPLLDEAQNRYPEKEFRYWDYRNGLITDKVDLIFSRTGLLQLSPEELKSLAKKLPKVDYLFIERTDSEIRYSHAHDYEKLFKVKAVGKSGLRNTLTIFTNLTT
jgi:SAM-dependent methyltransferase